MDLANIEKLLAKYLEAATTLQEEELLKTYFTSSNVAPHLQEYSSMFQYFVKSKSETFTKEIRLETKTQKRKWIGLVASIALLIGGYFAIQNYNEQQEAKQAYADTLEAFQMISKHINKGKSNVKELNNYTIITNKVFVAER